jgi:uncharacterized protein YkwD
MVKLHFARFAHFLCALAFLGLTLGNVQPAHAGPYLDYATGLNANPPQGSRFRPDLEELLAKLANNYRAGEGKGPLKADSAFREAARAHAADMMVHNFMGHKASTGHDFDSRMRVFVDDITRFPAMGENAARDTQKTPVDEAKAKALFQQWVNSSPHRKALRSRDYQFVSTGVIQRGNSIWAVQIFFATPRSTGMFSQKRNAEDGVSPSQ